MLDFISWVRAELFKFQFSHTSENGNWKKKTYRELFEDQIGICWGYKFHKKLVWQKHFIMVFSEKIIGRHGPFYVAHCFSKRNLFCNSFSKHVS